jgi:hypothetical protein
LISLTCPTTSLQFPYGYKDVICDHRKRGFRPHAFLEYYELAT